MWRFWVISRQCCHLLRHIFSKVSLDINDFAHSDPEKNWRHFVEEIFKCIFLNENHCARLEFHWYLFPEVWFIYSSTRADTGLAPVRSKPLSEVMAAKFTDEYVRYSASISEISFHSSCVVIASHCNDRRDLTVLRQWCSFGNTYAINKCGILILDQYSSKISNPYCATTLKLQYPYWNYKSEHQHSNRATVVWERHGYYELFSVWPSVNTLRPRQNGRHFPDVIFKWIFLNENVWISIDWHFKFVLRG